MRPDPIPPDRAVIDRIVEDFAVLHIGPEAVEEVVPAETLPAEACEGVWLEVHLEDGRVVIGAVDDELTRSRRAALDARMQAMREQRGGRRFGER